MALSSDMSAADIAAVTGGNNGGWGLGGDASWILILFLFMLFGWGNNGYGNNGGGANGGMAWPWALSQSTDSLVQSGFNQAATTAALGDLSNAITTGFAGAEVSRCNQMANLTNQLNTNAMALQQCCCQNQLGLANLTSTVLAENCADRAALSDGVRDILAAVQNQTTTILNQMCNDKLDAKNEKILELQNQLNMASLRESQTAQTAALIANNEAQTSILENYLQPPVRPCYVVPNPNCCGNYNYGYGCGGMA